MNNNTGLGMPYIFAVLLLTLSTASCSEAVLTDMTEELCLDIKVSDMTKVTKHEDYLPDGACIGVTIVEKNKDTYDGETYHNIRFTASGTGADQKWIPETPVNLSDVEGLLYVYYPYTENYENHEVTRTNDDDSDFMCGFSYNTISSSNKEATVYLSHHNFITRVRLKRGTYTGNGNITQIKIVADITWGSLKVNILKFGSYIQNSLKYSTPKIYDAEMSLDDCPIVESMWIPTQSGISYPLQVYVEIDGKTYYKKTPSKYIWNRGCIYDFTFKIND